MSSIVVRNDTYIPSYFVKEMHNVLHLNSKLKDASSEFGIENQSYVISCLIVPVMFLIIAFLCMLIFLIWPCCCSSIFHSKNNSNNYRNRLIIISCLIFCIIVAVFADQLMLFGYHPQLYDGVDKIIDNLKKIYDTFVILNDDGEELIINAYRMDEDLANATTLSPTCSQATLLIPKSNEYIDYLNDYNSRINDLPDKFSTARHLIKTYLVDYRDYFLYGLYALILFASIWYSIGCYLANKMFVRIGINCSQFFLILLFLLSTVIFFILIVSADFCIDPFYNLLSLIPKSSAAYAVVQYYVTCYGENPIQIDINEAHTRLNELKQSSNTLLHTYCPGNQYLLDASKLLDESNITISNLEHFLDCSTIQNYYQNIINEGACNEIYEGIYFVWLSYYVSAAGILFASFFLWNLFSNNSNFESIINEDSITALTSNDHIEIQGVNHHTSLNDISITDRSLNDISITDRSLNDISITDRSFSHIEECPLDVYIYD